MLVLQSKKGAELTFDDRAGPMHGALLKGPTGLDAVEQNSCTTEHKTGEQQQQQSLQSL
jgi:hypothetical protein